MSWPTGAAWSKADGAERECLAAAAGLGWRMVFLINLPIGLAAAWSARIIPESRAADALRVDWVGIGLAAAGLLLLLLLLLAVPRFK